MTYLDQMIPTYLVTPKKGKDIDLNILNKCQTQLNVVPPTPLQTLEYRLFESGLVSTTFEELTYSPTYCGPIIYSLAMSNGDPVPDFIQLNAINRAVDVFTQDMSAIGSYDVRIIGTFAENGFGIVEKISLSINITYVP